MVIALHDLARTTGNQQLRAIADRLVELAKKD